ncbi:hypothetical protein COLO4_22196 [Corchorus olitorius]|uniref:TF-B3 domain-containing protein n=1 Tax=Corchorus olitorius TaxID=93759 RepID=A0A1R3INI1_9ROSI|nr:hypothetical protein COLO4_22196 [Corchorus olitorius]
MMNSPEETIHFCKIILDDTIRFNKLRFPRKFARKYGRELSSPVRLTVPDGATFLVEVTKSDDGQVWLEKGWQQFSEHNSFKLGYYLVFDYEGNCSFHVLPFDISDAETEKPYISDSDDGGDEECLQPSKEVEEEEEAKAEDNSSAEILNQIPQCLEPNMEFMEEEEEETKPKVNALTETLNRKRKEKLDLPCLQPLKEMKVDETGTNSKAKTGITGQRSPQIEVIQRAQRLKGDERAKALQKAIGFRTENPFFIVVIQPSHLNFRHRMPAGHLVSRTLL